MYGDKLSRDSYEPHKDNTVNVGEVMSVFSQIQQIESSHKEQLQELAKDVVTEIWDVPREMLDSKLSSSISKENFDTDNSQPTEPITPELQKQINKRITLNTLTQGAALHQMQSMHHLVREKLTAIDPRLPALYDKLSKATHKLYWQIDYTKFSTQQKLGAAIGKEHVTWEDTEDGDSSPVIHGEAIIFPALAQELSKGVMEVLTTHGHNNLDPDTQGKVIKHADKFDYEVPQIQVGPALWKKFLALVPRGVIVADIVAALSRLEPDELHDLIAKIIDEPEEAKNRIKSLADGDLDEVENDINFDS